MKILTVSQMQQAERGCARFDTSLDMLMQNAGQAVAAETRRIVRDLSQENILVLIGPGNNGGDGLVAARCLSDWGTGKVKVYLCQPRVDDSNLEEVRKRGIHVREASDDAGLSRFQEWLGEATTILDAVFGTGKSRPLSGVYARVMQNLGEAKKLKPNLKLIALDIPSGLNADTGAVDPATPPFDYTITLGFPKVGLFNLPGAEVAGRISVVDIGIPESLVDYVNLELMDRSLVRSLLPRRPLVSHKGTYGKILALTGSLNYLGAAYLACTGSIRVGAGLTTLAIARSLQPALAAKLTEVTYLPLPESERQIDMEKSSEIICRQVPLYDILLMGCGLGHSGPVVDLVNQVLFRSHAASRKVVLDADALNILAEAPGWWEHLPENAILTPHAGEMSRLLERPVEEIQADRLGIARDAAGKWGKTVVLKGAYTVIASPDGNIRVSPFANPGLASAGTGDVLAGAIAGMAAQGLSLFDAAASGVYLHGLTGEMVKDELGDAGMLASDLLPVLPKAIRQLKQI